MAIKDMNLEVFLNELHSDSPAPGGGSVAALTSTISAALSGMVFNLTVGKKIYSAYDDETKEAINSALTKSKALMDEFIKLIDEDVEAFNKVIAAYKLPKATEEEKAIRKTRIDESYIVAMEVPLKTAKKTTEVFGILEVAALYGNPNAISDAGVGAILGLSAVESAILNVKINLGSIGDVELKEKVQKECNELVTYSKAMKERIMELVESKI